MYGGVYRLGTIWTTPMVEVDALTKQQIAFEVVELLEANHFDTLETLRLIAEPKKSWW